MNLLENNDQNDHFDPNKDHLEALTGPGGKFDFTKYPTKEDAYKAMARGKAEADHMIALKNKVTDELRADYLALREQATSGPKLQEQIDRLVALQQNSNNQHQNNMESQEKPVLGTEDINNLFETKIKEYETVKKAQSNFETVQKKLKETYGDNYSNTLKQVVDSLPGITAAEVNDLAMKSPDAVFRLLGLDRKPDGSFQAPPRGTQRTDHFAPGNTVRNEEYYDNLRQTNKKVYYDPKTQVQMHNDAIAQGSKFFKNQR